MLLTEISNFDFKTFGDLLAKRNCFKELIFKILVQKRRKSPKYEGFCRLANYELMSFKKVMKEISKKKRGLINSQSIQQSIIMNQGTRDNNKKKKNLKIKLRRNKLTIMKSKSRNWHL